MYHQQAKHGYFTKQYRYKIIQTLMCLKNSEPANSSLLPVGPIKSIQFSPKPSTAGIKYRNSGGKPDGFEPNCKMPRTWWDHVVDPNKKTAIWPDIDCTNHPHSLLWLLVYPYPMNSPSDSWSINPFPSASEELMRSFSFFSNILRMNSCAAGFHGDSAPKDREES